MGQSSRSVPGENRSGCPFLDNFDLDILSTMPVTGHNLVGRNVHETSVCSTRAQ
jgi:hypothetical protein